MSEPSRAATPSTSIANAWRAFAPHLADWALAKLVVRRDVVGAYRNNGGTYTAREPVTLDTLVLHFEGVRVIGAHSTSPDGRCLWVVFDIDAHTDSDDPEANWRCALAVCAALKRFGLDGFICDSNGKGGYHVRAMFKKPVESTVARWVCDQVEKELAEAKFVIPESFPKQNELSIDTPYGNWVRLPGKHHSRDFWTRVWDAKRQTWLEGEAAIKHLMYQGGDATSVLLKAYRDAQGEPAQPVRRNGAALWTKGKDELAKARSALNAIPNSASVDYDTWLGVGMSLTELGSDGCTAFHEWSSGSTKYDRDTTEAKYASLSAGQPGGITLGSLYFKAKANGWTWGNGIGAHSNSLAVHRPETPIAIEEGGREHDDEDRRPIITITTEEHVVIDAAVEAVAADPDVYQRVFTLVHVLRDESTKGVIRQAGTPTIRAVPQSITRKHMTKVARWVKWRKARNGEMELVPAHPPDWAVAGVFHQGSWPGIRHLEAVVETPVLRPDGTVLDIPGYDHSTGLLYEPSLRFPSVPTFPSKEEARAAAIRILEIVCDFPFAVITNSDGTTDAGQTHRAAWLAAFLTPMARFAINGPCPMFVFDANTSGSGKTKLCDIIAVSATGRMMSRTNYSESDEEMGKQILSIALAADRIILLDNVPTGGALGGPSLDRALTATTVSGRILGQSKMSGDLPMLTVFYATGNNLGLKGDGLRRIVPTRLESPIARPEERSGFKIDGDLLQHVARRRPSLVVDALTILRAYVVAGRPKPSGLTPMDYSPWCEAVRHPIHWALGVDPCGTRVGMVESDTETVALESLIQGWETLCEKVGKQSLTSVEAVTALDSRVGDVDLANLRGVMGEWSKDGKLPTPRAVGTKLAKVRGRVSGTKSLQFSVLHGNKSWFVKSAITKASAGGLGGLGGSLPSPRVVNCADTCKTHSESNDICPTSFTHTGGNGSHLSHLTGTTPLARETGEL
jgi:Primase C terminal 2 (PriCT-2)